VIIFNAVEKESSRSSDSEAGPEAVMFKDSRKNVLDRVRTAIRQIERDRQQLKAKRQKKDTVYKQQKVCLTLHFSSSHIFMLTPFCSVCHKFFGFFSLRVCVWWCSVVQCPSSFCLDVPAFSCSFLSSVI